ncbi:MAG: hypothetical protein HQL97_01430 [Magnetococcales bacterium]|nr:hypothetical protein [Magnetococcales bacterium]
MEWLQRTLQERTTWHHPLPDLMQRHVIRRNHGVLEVSHARLAAPDIHPDPAVAGNHLWQPLDPSNKSKESLIADKATSVSCDLLYESICPLTHSPATAGSRIKR